jgi:hypothetical protein
LSLVTGLAFARLRHISASTARFQVTALKALLSRRSSSFSVLGIREHPQEVIPLVGGVAGLRVSVPSENPVALLAGIVLYLCFLALDALLLLVT